MKPIFTLFLSLIVIAGFAQITATESDLPNVGDAFIVHIDTNTMVDLGSAAANQSWDFSGLQIDSISGAEFKPMTDLPFAAEFPTANMYTGDSVIGYAMYHKDVNGLEMVGYRTNIGMGMTNFNFANPLLLVGTPVTFTDQFNDTGVWGISYDLNPADADTFLTQTITKTIECDAWGSLTTPYGTYNDIIRLHSFSISVDLLEIKFGGVTFYSQEVGRDTTNEYNFLTNNAGYFVAIVKMDGAGSNIQSVEYLYTPVIAGDTIISIADGNWTTPTTWDCMCIPTPDDNITIYHDVVLDTDWYVENKLVIEATGSLIKNSSPRMFAVTNGTFTNAGTFAVDYFSTSNCLFENNDSVNIAVSFYSGGELINNMVITGLDSLYLDGNTENNGLIESTNLWNASFLTNNDEITVTNITNDGIFANNGILNFNDFTNLDSYYGTGDLFGSHDFSNFGTFNVETGTAFNLSNDFFNSDITNNDALFLIDGSLTVGGSWLNQDTIEGYSGNISVAMNSSNQGVMIGTFDFCDLTPPAGWPYIDFNSGIIGPDVTFCGEVGVMELSSNENIQIYPNPARNYISIETIEPAERIQIIDIRGKVIIDINLDQRTSYSLDVSDLPAGLYSYKLYCMSASASGRIIIE